MQMQCNQKTVDFISPTRFHRHIVAAAAVAMGAAAASNAAVVYSGVINFVCAVDIDGCYINVETGVLSNGPGSGVPGWDVNPYSSGGGMNFFNSTGGGQMRCPGVTTGPAGNLGFLGASIGATGSFNTSTTAVVFGSAAGNWQYSAENVIGFRFVAAAGTTHYGWMRFRMGAAGSSGTSMTRTVVDYAYESTPGAPIGWPSFACTIDTDLDGRPDCNDNCINIANPTQADCNNNGIGNACEIAAGAPDYNRDTIPDHCQCLADLFVDHQVNGADLGALLSQWGPANTNTASDMNRDGVVNGADLGYLLYAWGPCTN